MPPTDREASEEAFSIPKNSHVKQYQARDRKESLNNKDEYREVYKRVRDLKGGLKEFLKWNDAEEVLESMIVMLNQAVDADSHWDKVYNDYTTLIKKCNRLMVAEENLGLENQRLLIEKEEFDNKIHEKEVIIQFLKQENREATPQSTTSTVNESKKNKVKPLADPEKLNGIRNQKGELIVPFDQWEMQIINKLKTDAHLFDTENRRIEYVADRTEKYAYNYV